MKDPEHLDRIVAAQEAGNAEDAAEAGPPQNVWSHELEALVDIKDGIAHLGYLLRAVNGDKKANPPKSSPKPGYARLIAARNRFRQKAHEALTARVLRR